MSTRTSQLHIVDGITSADCQKQVRSWSLLRSIMWFIIPSCTGNISDQQLDSRRQKGDNYDNNKYFHYLQPRRSRSVSPPPPINTTTTAGMKNISTGTLFGYRQGKVTFCIQSKPDSNIPTLLLELAIPTAILAKEMKSGLLRIALECKNGSRHSSSNLLSVPVWTMYCNERKAGSAVKRVPTQADKKVLSLMREIDEGVGIINAKTLLKSSVGDNYEDRHSHGDLMYLRANFERVSASSNSESFHLINQDGSSNQQLIHIMATRNGGAVRVVDGVTSVDCHNQVRSWSLLRSVMWFIIPSCTRNYTDDQQQLERRKGGDYYYNNNNKYLHYLQPRRNRSVSPPISTKTSANTAISSTTINNILTGTIYGYRHGKVNFCIQSNPDSNVPTLLLELAIPTAVLAKEMRSGLLRIALECNTESPRHSSSSHHLLSVPVWTMYCNGRKVGSAMKRVATQADKKVLSLMRNVDEGVGIINGKTSRNSTDGDKEGNQYNHDDDLMYLRANFERVCGSSKSESFHLINQDGSNSQQLSVFFIRTR
ncbi:hypothetical protein MKX01_007060 [Papaver californicum]|nr:hypothetical protein MKX01_007060 [Papaver californicum]